MRIRAPFSAPLVLFAGSVLLAQAAVAQLSLTVLHSFTGGADGQQPQAALVQATNGVLYGTTYMGGTNNAGTVFKVNPDGSSNVPIYQFPKNPFSPGGLSDPSGLIQGADGALYGASGGGGNGWGSLFRINLDGTGYTNIHVFNSSGGGAYQPSAALLQGSDGYLYGTTMYGGAYSLGTIFKVRPNGDGFVQLRSLGGSYDAQQPFAPLIQGQDGFLYGTTQLGGNTAVGGASGFGTIFKISSDGSTEVILHNFQPAVNDGHYPHAALVQSANGTLFGVTYEGGSTTSVDGSGYGTIFKLNPDGSGFTILHNFDPTVAGGDGKYPWPSLVIGNDGALYGTCSGGGSGTAPTGNYGAGTVFKINQDGSGYTVLYNFGSSSADGYSPRSPLVRASDGGLFATTPLGGANNGGVLFRLAPSPPVLALLTPTSGKQMQIGVRGAPRFDYRIEASTDHVHWVVFTNVYNSNGTVVISDPDAFKYSCRFYRAAWVP
jgi:uncharacterized repeat protein (TIGR03803 family)